MMTYRFRSIGVGALATLVVSFLTPFTVFGEFALPPNDGFLTDTTDIISPADEQAIEQRLQTYKDATSNEIAVVILKSLDGYVIEDAALEIGRKWGVGSVKNNGLLLIIAYEDREVRLEVGYGLEGAVPDLVAKGIIETDITPHFRDGDYAGGINAAIDALQKHIGNEYTADRYAVPDESSAGPFAFFFGLILLQWLIAILGRTKSWWMGGIVGGMGGVVLAVLFSWWLAIPILVLLGLLLDFIVSRSYHARGNTPWWAGGGWGPGGGGRFGGGGGFGGFGGGSFGGGGASGRW